MAVIENLNYEAGRNPNNVSFIMGLGWKRQRATANQYAWNDHRIFPPSGNPIGNINYRFTPDVHNYQLNAIYFPVISAGVTDTTTSFAMHDRWADAYNIETEFVHPQTARGLAVAALIAAESTANRSQAWSASDVAAAAGTITAPDVVRLNTPTVAQLNSSLDLSQAAVIWDLQQHQPAFGPSYTFIPTTVGDNRKLEAEAVFPDGRRVFALKTFAVYDWYEGGTEFAKDGNTIALYHFNGDYLDASDNQYHLTASGNVTFADNTTWMIDYPNAGRVVRFRGVGDELRTTIPGDPFLPNTTPKPGLKISLRIYPRAYKPEPSASIFELSQGGSVFASWAIYNVQFTTPQAPRIQGPSQSFQNISVLVTAEDVDRYLTLNTWHEVRIELASNGRTSVHIDGVLRNTPANSRLPDYVSSSDWTLTLGNFDGDIDELRISR